MRSPIDDSLKHYSYWWDRTPLETESESESSEQLPTSADVVIIGAGYTGLHAAIETANAGLSTVVVDAYAPGWGCSTRNGGQISTSIKPGFATLRKRYGEAPAHAIQEFGKESLAFVDEFIKAQGIECNYGVVGRFHGAHSRSAFKKLVSEFDHASPVLADDVHIVSPDDTKKELGTERYHGGVVFHRHASVDPGKYHAACLQAARNAGTKVIGFTPVTHIDNRNKKVQTPSGAIQADQILVATNGYTGLITPWLQRRVIPIGSYIIATDEIDPVLMRELLPTQRILSDTRKLVYYYRPCPEHKRIIFGGRVSLSETDLRRSASKLHAELIRLFPALKDIKVTHSWSGSVAYTFDTLMHHGQHEGIHHALGYCGSGVGMASYLGHCTGKRMAGDTTEMPLEAISFPTRPLYHGRPWFLAPSVLWYRLQDAFS